MYLDILEKALEFYEYEGPNHSDYELHAIWEALDEIRSQRTHMYNKDWSNKVHLITKEGLEDLFDECAYDIFGKVARECLNEHYRPSYVRFTQKLDYESEALSHINAVAAGVGFYHLESRWWSMERMGNNRSDGTFNKEV